MKAKDLHGLELRPGDRIWLPHGAGRTKTGRPMGDEAIVLRIEQKPGDLEPFVRYRYLKDPAREGVLFASRVRRRRGRRR